jgi:hypothetical protein
MFLEQRGDSARCGGMCVGVRASAAPGKLPWADERRMQV